MKKELKKWAHANYEITLTVTPEEQDKAKELIIKEFQKEYEAPGFRKGFAPLDVVEKNIKPEHVTRGIAEKLIGQWLQDIIKEHPEIRFIGNPYDFKQVLKDKDTVMDIKLDIFPEVEVLNNHREKEVCTPIDDTVTDKEIQDTLINIKKNYADYLDTEHIALGTISKIALEYKDKDDKVVHTWHTYVGEQEFDEDKFFQNTFLKKKKNEEFELDYDDKKLPIVLHHKKADIQPTKIKFIVQDVKQIVLPEFTLDLLKKLFGEDTKITTEAELIDYIKESIQQQKGDTELMKKIEEILQHIRNQSLKVVVPQTLVQEEFTTRIKSLEQRLWGQEKLEAYIKNMGDEKAKAFFEDIQKAAAESLEKFFILQKFTQLLSIEIDWAKAVNLEVEHKIYEKLLTDKSAIKAKPAKKIAEKKWWKAHACDCDADHKCDGDHKCEDCTC